MRLDTNKLSFHVHVYDSIRELPADTQIIIRAFLKQHCNFQLAGTGVAVLESNSIIHAVCSFRSNSEIVEIYDVCVAVASRRQRLAHVMLSALIREWSTRYSTIWLGTMIDAEQYVATLYIKLGFANPRLTRTTPLGMNIALRDPVIGWTYSKTLLTPQETHQLAIDLGKSWVATNYVSPTSYSFEYGDLQVLYNLAYSKQNEWAGTFRVVQHKLVLDRSSFIQGTDYEVEAIPGCFVFHTHPLATYEKERVSFGSPSTQDFVSSSFLNNLSIVVALEGLYVIEYLPLFRLVRNYIQKVFPEVTNEFFHALQNTFNGIHEIRSFPVEFSKDQVSIMEQVRDTGIPFVGIPAYDSLVTKRITQVQSGIARLTTANIPSQVVQECIGTLVGEPFQFVKLHYVSWIDIRMMYEFKQKLSINISLTT